MAANPTAIPDDSHPGRCSGTNQAATSELPPSPAEVASGPHRGCGLQHCCAADWRVPCEAGWPFVVASCLCFLLPLVVATGVVFMLDDVVGEPIALAAAVVIWWVALRGARFGRCALRRWTHAAS